MQTKIVTYIDWHEFESLVEEAFPLIKDYSIVADAECGNDCALTFNTTPKDVERFIKDKYDQERLNEMLEKGKWGYTSHLIVTYLTMKGILPIGDLVIEVSW